MLVKFINFQDANYDPQDGECREYALPESCDLYEGYALPTKVGDTIKWIQDVGGLLSDWDLEDLKIGLARCGQIEYQDIGEINQNGSQLFCSATIPEGVDLDCYEFIIYVPYQFDLDCTQFECSTLQDLIDSDLYFGDTSQCIPDVDWACTPVLLGEFTCANSNTISGVLAGSLEIGQTIIINDEEYTVESLGFLSATVSPSTLPVGDLVEVYIYE